jgi:hypothetical protein
MNQKILTIILAVLLIAGFFLPFGQSFESGSAFDIVQAPSFGSEIEVMIMKYGWLLIPVSGLALLIGALNKEHYVPARIFWALLPLLFLLYFVIRPVIDGVEIAAMLKLVGIGFYVMLVGALVLAVYHPKKA